MHGGKQKGADAGLNSNAPAMPLPHREISWVDQAPELQERICPVMLAGEDRKLTGGPAGPGILLQHL